MNPARLTEDLRRYGINGTSRITYNPCYEELFALELSCALPPEERGRLTKNGAVAVYTGKYTGRSPKDKYIVREPSSEGRIWWSGAGSPSDNKPLSQESWEALSRVAAAELSNKPLFVVDGFCGASPRSRLGVRFVTEIAWQAHFVKNLFIRPTDEELASFEPDFVTLNAARAANLAWREEGLNSEVAVAFHFGERRSLILGTLYGGEMKKGIFTLMNYLLPLKGIASMHCSANLGAAGDTAIFFGLSGTGKTTLSTDPNRALIGDDEHGWDDEGIFNLEGGCYAKVINLDRCKEPQIYAAIRRDALLENVIVSDEGEIDFADGTITENTRVSYPIGHIDNSVRPLSKGGHARTVIFLTADAFGIFPPVARLSPEQAQYHFLSGFTSKLAGTEQGVTLPVPTFSACFGAAFLPLHPTIYAVELARKMAAHGARAYLVNTGWVGGPYGVGRRIDINTTRAIINAILDGEIERAESFTLPVFGLVCPAGLPGIPDGTLNPRASWSSPAEWDAAAERLAALFVKNFERFCDSETGRALAAAGPRPPMATE